MNKTIGALADGMLDIYHSSGYAQRTIRSISYTLNGIVAMHTQGGFEIYNPEVIQSFNDDVINRYHEGTIGRIRYNHLLRISDHLSQYHLNGEIDFTIKNTLGLSSYYERVLHDLSIFPDWNEKTKTGIRSIAITYMKWLASQGIDSFKSVDSSVVRAYLIDCGNRLSCNSIDTIRRGLKKFHVFLAEIGEITDDYSSILTFSTPTEHRIKRPADSEEVAKVLSCIDRDTPIGKRDYAVILLAVATGLRSIDLVELTFEEIDWVKGELIITQQKTGNQIALPLTKDVGMALQDYILHGRPENPDPHVFLRCRPPYNSMGNGGPYGIYNRYRKLLGLSKAPFHGLRRAVGSNMVIAGVPVTTVAQVLGHSSVEPTKQYISLDSVNLQQCALSLGALSTTLGGAR